MDLAKALADLFTTLGSAGPSTIIFVLFAAHLLLDVVILRACLRRGNPLLVPGWIYEDLSETAVKATAAAASSAQVNRDLTDALIRRTNDESRMGRDERRHESAEQWRSGGQPGSDRVRD